MIIDRFSDEPLSHEELFTALREISIADVKSLIYKVEDLLMNERRLIQLTSADTIVIGDMHGDIGVTLAITQLLEKGVTNLRMVFLGDYVDRGPHQVDVINLVLLLKVTFPDRVTLLRGNHEIPVVNETHGFQHNLMRQFGREDGQILWYLYNRLFRLLPIAAVTWNGYFLVHGGIPEDVQDLHEIENLPREIIPENRITFELLWNDPVELKKPIAYRKNSRGGGSKEFGELAIDMFFARTNTSKIIRAHEEFNDGFKYFFNERLLSIFSSRRVLSGLFERQIKPKVVRIDKEGRLSIESIDPVEIST